MLDEATSNASSDIFSQKKHKLLQRLEQRRPIGQADSSAEVVKSRNDELDEALSRAQAQVESGAVDEHTIKELENFLSLEDCGWSAKRIQNALKLLRKAGMEASNGSLKQPSFSFSALENKQNPVISESPQPQLPISSERSTFEPKRKFDNSNEIRIVTGKDGSDVKLKEIRSCEFSSQIFATAQQIRIHNSHDLRIHAGVRAAIIIESCTDISMAPYRVVYNGSCVEVPDGNAWMRPNDFDWFAEGQSPNWMVAPESEWETCVIRAVV
ncbi:hypothetical protein Angca_008348 [Angiostrongylus cantonensis]|nr:hypothetical protein Angca_008348 [Angiostrongylus cantonensis]